MIVIISDCYDSFTTEVELWLQHFKTEYIRINAEDNFSGISVRISNSENSILFKPHPDSSTIELFNSTIWYRRGFFKPTLYGTQIGNDFTEFGANESRYLFEAIIMILSKEGNVIGTHLGGKDNRLYNQYLAQVLGLMVPDTMVTTSKSDVLAFISMHNAIVTKPISDIFRGKVNGVPARGKVMDVTNEMVESLPENFFPMCFQQTIQRTIELRVFVCKNLVNAVAMVMTESSEVDARFAVNESTRLIPYNLPSSITAKIINVLNLLNLDTASFDFIITEHGDYYFLELNPFGMLHNNSFTHFYSTEKRIAELLIGYENN